MLKLDVQTSGTEGLGKAALKISRKVLQKSMFKMEELAIKKAPRDRGFLRQNIKLSPRNLSNEYTLVSKAPYSEDLEYGNSPRFVKIEDIEDWIKRKGIRTTEAGAFAFAKYVQDKIAREGVNAQPFMRPAFYEVKDYWLKIYKEDANFGNV